MIFTGTILNPGHYYSRVTFNGSMVGPYDLPDMQDPNPSCSQHHLTNHGCEKIDSTSNKQPGVIIMDHKAGSILFMSDATIKIDLQISQRRWLSNDEHPLDRYTSRMGVWY